MYSKQPYTEYISTRWYRAPECLLTDGYYGYKMVRRDVSHSRLDRATHIVSLPEVTLQMQCPRFPHPIPLQDLWGIGCVMFECLALYPLFPGTNEADQLDRIHRFTGSPSPELVAKFKAANGGAGSSHVNYNFAPVSGFGLPGRASAVA